jgi:hypothetical protein
MWARALVMNGRWEVRLGALGAKWERKDGGLVSGSCVFGLVSASNCCLLVCFDNYNMSGYILWCF